MKKIIFIIYAAVAVATGLCALMFKDYLNINGYSLIPAGVTVVHIILGCLVKIGKIHFRRGRLRIFSFDDFKYSKNSHGKGEFQSVETRRRDTYIKLQKIMGYAFIIAGAFAFPFVLFFSVEVKFSSIVLLLIPVIVGRVADIRAVIIESRAEIAAAKSRSEQHQRELEEQEKRESLGKWK